MAKIILLEEFHLGVYALGGLPEADYEAMRQALDDTRFQARLRRLVQRLFHRQAALARVKVRLSR